MKILGCVAFPSRCETDTQRRPGCSYIDLGVAYVDIQQGSPVAILDARSPDNDLYLRIPHVRGIGPVALAIEHRMQIKSDVPVEMQGSRTHRTLRGGGRL